LMKPMSCHFAEIHGVDVSEAMIERAVRNLRDLPGAFPRVAGGSDLAGFADDSFDFVYSYAVFQHIPSRAVVLSYLREVVRVLGPGGIARLQINGLPEREGEYTTWDGVRFTGQAIREFTRHHGVQLLALEGERTQYMWTTWRKPAAVAGHSGEAPRIQAILNAHTGDRVVPSRGSLACCSVWVEHLPAGADLNTLHARIDGTQVLGSYVGEPKNGLSQVNFFLPTGVRTGLVPLELVWRGEPLCAPAVLRVIPPGPAVPRVSTLTDGTNLLSERRIESGVVKLSVEQIERPEALSIKVDDQLVEHVAMVCTDPLNAVYDCSFRLPVAIASGPHSVAVAVGTRRLPAVSIEVL
jgi:Methyltransferase domain